MAEDNLQPKVPEPAFEYPKGFEFRSFYLPMRDGVQIATDLYLPKKLKPTDKLPTVMFLSRYVRSIQAKKSVRALKPYITTTVHLDEIQYWVRHGYAVMVVDTRGSGASTGVRKMEMSPDEVADGVQLADWVVGQPWSNGRIGTSGVSYLGTTSVLALANQHPAFRAAIPRHSIFDLYADLSFVNGVPQYDFVSIWGTTTRSLDANNFFPFAGKLSKLLDGIRPVDADSRFAIRDSAIKLHSQNFDFVREFPLITYRDHIHPTLNTSIDAFSVHSYWPKIAQSKVAIYWLSGWYDGALSNSSLKGFYNSPTGTARLRMGPWDHGPLENASPWSTERKVTWNQLREFRAFFDLHLRDRNTGELSAAPVQYYTLGEEKWHGSATWPPAGFKSDTLWLAPAHRLQTRKPTANILPEQLTIDTTATSGLSVRYNSQTQLFRKGPIAYPNRVELDKKNLLFETEPLPAPTEITGHPLVSLYLSADAEDAQVFAYLEEVLPDGRVVYITEGMLRAQHQRIEPNPVYKAPFPQHSFRMADAKPLVKGQSATLTFDMFGVSYLAKQGSKLRISIAGADKGHFALLPTNTRPSTLTIYQDAEHPSHIVLPTKQR
jgi:uncharacterized protein